MSKLKSFEIIERILMLPFNKKVIMLIGVPGCGKSTFSSSLISKDSKNKFLIASTDEFFENKAIEDGITYNNAMKKYNFKDAEKLYKEKIKIAIDNNFCLILDQTNCSIKSRGKKLRSIPNDYYKIAVFFHINQKTLEKRLQARLDSTGKFISESVIKSMQENLSNPTFNEGFDSIFELDNN